MTTSSEEIPLTAFQLEVAQLFFSLPASEGFVLAGGAALIAQHLTSRPTQDLDFFTAQQTDVVAARDELIAAAHEHGWTVHTIQDEETFSRLQLAGPEDLLVDIALDARPEQPPTMSVAGPTYAPRELAARKVIALFDRFAARDFVDVFALIHTYRKEELLAWASDLNPGFDLRYFVEALDTLPRYTDLDLSLGVVDVAALRAFFSEWVHELREIPV
ncbi:nucleotidyl transferase AbiEii/AbiGii toxin family protein [Actinophytocola oryzae]|uniref:Putative nucleotidyltransferase component of viral defense system n=1 Tax=Actinophytocola oryzae TaxID=502181 RepID=A0A4R7V6D7_9PSEU|nr:nucleotidyl transferase AbiEii/AbiGii toxin family protein [Actinophytocola oryzae]TDV44247.1 putative nucleotidyltransferase component of viral defense system [Actinophytocola oryzae]